MRIAYLISWRGGARTGPFKKIAAQSRTWQDLGHDVRLFVTTSEAAALDWARLEPPATVEVVGRGPAAGLTARRRAYRALRRWDPDVVYLRHGVYAPGLGGVVRHYPTVLEVNGDEVAIARQTSRLKAAWASRTRAIVLSRAVGAVFMTDELASAQGLAGFGFERLVLPNGIDLAATPQLPPTATARPRLVLLGHPHSPWHGTDKLVGLARRHPEWEIDVIGPTAEDLGAAAPDNLTLHPELPAEGYLPLVAAADVGIGSLAMHRIGASENPALKVREYLALGLPVIIGCRDPDFPTPVDFVLELPNREASLEQADARIAEFVRSWQGRRVPRDRIGQLDLLAKERERLSFLARLARASRPSRSGGPTMDR